MALDPVPWMIGGGAEHSEHTGRTLAYLASGGGEGVAAAADCKVSANGSASVTVAPGVVAIRNTYDGQTKQTYVGRVVSNTSVSVTPTGGSSRSDMVVLRIDDPNLGGATPASVPNGPYWRLAVLTDVGAGATKVPSGLGYPAVPLARIDLPASTTGVTSGMIVDIRELAQPKSTRRIFMPNVIGDSNYIDTTNTAGKTWANADFNIAIPDWATKMRVVATVSGVRIGNGPIGKFWVRFDGSNGDQSAFDAADNAGFSRTTMIDAHEFPISAAQRGTNRSIGMRAFLTSGNDKGGGRPLADLGTVVLYDIEFVEDPQA